MHHERAHRAGHRTEMHTRASEGTLQRALTSAHAQHTADRNNRQRTDKVAATNQQQVAPRMLTNACSRRIRINAGGRLHRTGSVTDRGHAVTLPGEQVHPARRRGGHNHCRNLRLLTLQRTVGGIQQHLRLRLIQGGQQQTQRHQRLLLIADRQGNIAGYNLLVVVLLNTDTGNGHLDAVPAECTPQDGLLHGECLNTLNHHVLRVRAGETVAQGHAALTAGGDFEVRGTVKTCPQRTQVTEQRYEGAG